MKKSIAIILAGFICIMMITAGCTSTSSTKPVTTTPAATTAAVIPSTPVTVATIVAPSTNTSWSGTWNTTYSSADKSQFIAVLSLTQNGSLVKGTYNNGNGSINATEKAGKLTGNWFDSDRNGTYAGLFEFTRSADDKSFTGTWVSASEGNNSPGNSTLSWNGTRV